MKNNILTLMLSSVLLFSSCQDDYLELDPLDAQTEASYFRSTADFKAASNDFYNKMISWKPINSSSVFSFMDFGTDLTSLAQEEGRGNTIAANSDIYWTNPYKYIRANNILLKAADQYTGDKTAIAQYVAAAKFFRAWHHFFFTKTFWRCTYRNYSSRYKQ